MSRTILVVAAVTLVLAGCAAAPPASGSVGRSTTHPTLTLQGTVAQGIALEFWVEYVATNATRRCTRRDGESGRVLLTRRFHYAADVHDGRFRLEMLLDPHDVEGCGLRPLAVHYRARDLLAGLDHDGYAPLAGFASGTARAVTQDERWFHCQGWPVDGPRHFACSLPRRPNPTGHYCTGAAELDCAGSCEIMVHFERVVPPRADALWAVPAGCPRGG